MNQSNLPNIEIRRIARLLGPNIWSNHSVLEVWLDLGAFEEFPSDKLEGFTDSLMGWLPSLIEHRCSEGVRGGFLTRLRDGTWMGHVLEHVTLELQTLAHAPVGYGRARETGQYGVYRVVIECLQPDFAERCLAAGLAMVHAAARRQAFDIEQCLATLRAHAAQTCLQPSTQAVVSAAQRLGFPAIRLTSGDLVQLGYGRHGKRVWSGQTDRTAAVADAISKEAPLANRLLAGVGLPIVERTNVDSEVAAWAAAAEMGDKVVVRPLDSTLDSWPDFLAVSGENAVRQAYKLCALDASGARGESDMSTNTRPAMVEQWVPGLPHRVLVIGERAVAACVSRATDASSVNDIRRLDVSDELHPDVANSAVLAAQTIGLDIAVVELIAPDLRSPLAQSGGAVFAVNGNPDLLAFGSAEHGGKAIGEAMVKHLFEGAVDPEFKVFAVSGGGKERTVLAALMAYALNRAMGLSSALASTSGLWLSDRRVATVDARTFEAGLSALTHPLLDALVLECSASRILSEGIPFTYCNVAVVLDISETGVATGPWDAPPYLTPELVRKAVRTPADVIPANGWLVLNADVEGIASMAERCNGRVMYFSQNASNALVASHVRAGERAVAVLEGSVVLCSGALRTPLFNLASAALFARAGVAEDDGQTEAGLTPAVILAATAALLCSGVTPDAVEGQIVSFLRDELFHEHSGQKLSASA